MKSISKLLRRFAGILFLSSFLLLFINLVILGIVTFKQTPNARPWKSAEQAVDYIEQAGKAPVMSDEILAELNADNAWAIYIDNTTGKCLWHSDNLPDTIPLEYTASDIANLTRGYIDGYPTFTGEGENGLIILGYPKESFWKHMWPSWDYSFIANLPRNVLIALAVNILLIFIIYMAANTKLLKSIKPITDGIQSLPTGQPVVLKEKGVLSEISANINQTSEVLQNQKFQLKKKETARANWIAGVSHDIRTPLSMVMGYASQLENDKCLSDKERQKAAAIVRQSERMRNLINDLNLVSKLEYNMQPTHIRQINVISTIRQVIVDFINLDIDNKYSIEWLTSLNVCMLNADKDLIKRAVSNLIQNSINHNSDGCTIYVSVKADDKNCRIIVSDNGAGVTDEKIDRLNNSPHYMVCDENTSEQRHGLGLLIVKQIVAAHKGTVKINHSEYGGFEVEMCLPLALNGTTAEIIIISGGNERSVI